MASSKLSLEFPIASANIGGFDWCCLSFGKSTVCYGISALLIIVESSKNGPSIPLAIAEITRGYVLSIRWAWPQVRQKEFGSEIHSQCLQAVRRLLGLPGEIGEGHRCWNCQEPPEAQSGGWLKLKLAQLPADFKMKFLKSCAGAIYYP